MLEPKAVCLHNRTSKDDRGRQLFSIAFSSSTNRCHTQQTILRNNLCLFDQSGFGSCAYLYPFSINDERGKFLDPWANDQDWALIYAMRFLDR
ncbi:MAG: hypothetical protein EOM15_13685 [Spirochaetia bacterium]|nr:hypothetical protein [Spirochaetia bacterium]